jgi:hypothetical protein
MVKDAAAAAVCHELGVGAGSHANQSLMQVVQRQQCMCKGKGIS